MYRYFITNHPADPNLVIEESKVMISREVTYLGSDGNTEDFFVSIFIDIVFLL